MTALTYSAGAVVPNDLKKNVDASVVFPAVILIYAAGGVAFFAGLIPGADGFGSAAYSAWLFAIFGIAAYGMFAFSLGVALIMRAAHLSPGPVSVFLLLLPPLVPPAGAAAVLELFFSPVYGLLFRSGGVQGRVLSLFAGEGSLWVLALCVYVWRTLPLLLLIAILVPVSGSIPRRACWTERLNRLSTTSLIRTAGLSAAAALLLFTQNAAAVIRLNARYPYTAASDGITLFREALVPGYHYYAMLPLLVFAGILLTGLWYGQKNHHC